MSGLGIKLSLHATLLAILLYATCHIGSAKNCDGLVNSTVSKVQPFCQNGTMTGKDLYLAGGRAYAKCGCNITNTGSGNIILNNINGENSNCTAVLYAGVMGLYECDFPKGNTNMTLIESVYLERHLGKLIEDEFSFCLKLSNTLGRNVSVTCAYPIDAIRTTPIPTTTTTVATTTTTTAAATTAAATTAAATTTTTTTTTTTVAPTTTHPHGEGVVPATEEGGSMMGIIVGVVVGVIVVIVCVVVWVVLKKNKKVETV